MDCFTLVFSMDTIINLILLFFAYSFVGWCIEVTLKYFQYHRFINRGFLTGPWLPIYGSGAVLITLAVTLLAPYDSGYGTTFAISFVVCGLVEYGASWYMEKRFHARWWDYSQKPMNLNGRVWIGNLILFGLGGLVIRFMGNPLLLKLFNRISLLVREYMAAFLAALIAADFAVTHFVLKLVKSGIDSSEADNTEQIRREIQALVRDRSYFHRRLADAYPEVTYRTERVKNRMTDIKAETERLRGEVEQRLAQGKAQLATSLEPSASIRSDLIQKQQALLALTYDEASATDEMRALKREIDEKAARLRDRKLW